MPQLSNSGRVVTLIAVSQGNVYYAVAGATAWALATNNTGSNPPLNFTGVLFSTSLNQKLWFADGVNYVYYVPITNTVERWVATAGTLPVDANNNTPRLIATWRGRMVLSGLLDDPQNWFMSAVDTPTDFDYSPISITPTQAIAGNNSQLGMVGDVVTALVPYSDDLLFFGGDHTIYVMRGDPMAGGQLDRVSDVIGFAWGEAWCKDPYGNIYFVSNRMGIYMLNPGQGGQPQRISQAIEELLIDTDTGSNAIRMIWDDRFQGLHVFISPLEEPGPATHYFFEQRTGAWWQDEFANENHNPLCCCTFDGNLPDDRVPLIGSWDGYVRTFSPEALNDDGAAIACSVTIGPLTTKTLDELMLWELQGVLGETSGDVTYEVFVGTSAESALSSEPVASGVWEAGRNASEYINLAGYAVYVKLSSDKPFAMELIRAKIRALGRVRQRGS